MRRLLVLLVALLSVPAASAQWASDPALNLLVAGGPGEQVQPKTAPTFEGGLYVSWLDGGAGYDVRLQRFSPEGVAEFAPGGLLVADRSFSSTVDYDLAVDAAGNAVLAFRDDRGSGIQITAALVTTDGIQPWGPTGSTLTATADFVANPKVTLTSDGQATVAWFQGADTRVQGLFSDGVPRWTEDITIASAQGSTFPADLQAVGLDVVLSVVNQTGGVSSPKHLLAQKLDADGAALWGDTPVVVFDGGSLQNGTFPPFELDGSGGAVFSWYDVAGPLQCFVQRLDADGVEVFAPNGVAVSTAPGERVAPDLAVDPATGETYVFWTELGAAGAQGVSGQKLGPDGARLWGDAGYEVVPTGPGSASTIRTERIGAGALVAWNESPAFGQDRLRTRAVSGDAPDVAFDVSFATTPSSKGRLSATPMFDGAVAFVWNDTRTDGGDIYAQHILPNGAFDPIVVSAESGAALSGALRVWPNPTAGVVTVEASPPAGGPATVEVFDALGRRVATHVLASGSGDWAWDGRSSSGAAVAPGIYVVRVRQGGWERTARIVRR